MARKTSDAEARIHGPARTLAHRTREALRLPVDSTVHPGTLAKFTRLVRVASKAKPPLNAPFSLVVAALVVGMHASQADRSTPQGATRLDPKIPAPIEAQYRNIRDAKDWRNPKLDVGADGITVNSLSLRSGRKTASANELRAALVSLPITDWPYGRVVGAQDPSIRSGRRSEDAEINRHHAIAEQVLKDLDIRANWWPPEPQSVPDRAPRGGDLVRTDCVNVRRGASPGPSDRTAPCGGL
jgi:hypothetical protein